MIVIWWGARGSTHDRQQSTELKSPDIREVLLCSQSCLPLTAVGPTHITAPLCASISEALK